MGHGGKREGAGRPHTVTKSAEAIISKMGRYYDVEAIAAAGLTPLEVMVEAMRFFRSQAAKQQSEQKPNSQFITDMLLHACSIAKDAAPYMHARMSASDIDPIANIGKKELRDREAKTAGVGTPWQDIIRTPGQDRPN